jgi:amidase
MTSPNELSAAQAAAAIREGRLTSVALVEACLERIAQREPYVGAWEYLDQESALACARECDKHPPRGPLHGVPIAIKDIIETEGMPTSYGSAIYRGQRSAGDASCVTLMKRAGAIVLGKTVSTEFAYFKPGKTANPHNLAHTPGGSSSGSAAAVADFMAPMAFGTQTAASLIRPASYCGIVGFKPSYGTFNLAGIKPFAPSFDTLGTLTRDVDDAALMYQSLLGTAPVDLSDPGVLRIGLCRTPWWSHADLDSKIAVESAAEHFADNGARVGEVMLPKNFDRLVDVHKLIMAYEAGRSLAHEFHSRREYLSESICQLIGTGLSTSRTDYEQACAEMQAAQRQIQEMFNRFDAFVTLSAPGEAPLGLAATGDPIFSRMWTLLHVPSLSLPGWHGATNLPVGVQVVCPIGEDRDLLRIGKWAEACLRG